MATNLLTEFIHVIKRDSIARSTRFRINFTIPDVLLSMLDPGLKTQKTVSLTCLNADIPSRQEQTSTINYGNYDRKLVFGRSMGDFSTTFLLTGKYTEKKLFDGWHDIICDETQTAVEFYDDYIAGITVECLDTQDNVVYSYELTEAYPLSVSALKLDRTAQNGQMTLDVTWAYHRLLNPTGRSGTTTPKATGLAAIVPGSGSGVKKFMGIDISSLSSAAHTAMDAVQGVRTQIQGALAVVKTVQENIRDFKMGVLDGIKTINGVVLDVKKMVHVPIDLRNEVVAVINDSKNQLGSLRRDVKGFSTYPTK
jgi:hypothetical protein